jgi:hypothetical protein
VDVALAGGGGGGRGALAFPVEQGGAEGQVAVAGGGEKRASLLRRVMNSRSVALAWCQITPSRWIQGESVLSTP